MANSTTNTPDAIPADVMELARRILRSVVHMYSPKDVETVAAFLAADRAARAPVDGAEPVAWMFAIARDCDSKTGEPCNWKKLVSFSAPNAGKYQRNLTPLYLTPPAPAASPACGGEVERAGTLLDSLDRIADRLGDEGDADSKKCIRALSAEIRSALVEAQAPAAAPDAELVRRVESELPGLFWEPNERGNLGTLRIRAHATGLGEIIARNVTMEHGKLIVSAILSKHGGDHA